MIGLTGALINAIAGNIPDEPSNILVPPAPVSIFICEPFVPLWGYRCELEINCNIPSTIPTEAADKWTKRFNNLFKKRHYGELKDKNKR